MSDPVSKPPAKMSSRERDELLKKGIQIAPPQVPVLVQQVQENDQQTPQPQLESQPQPQPKEEPLSTSPSTKEELSPQHSNIENIEDDEQNNNPRGFVCEQCKWCDGFEPLVEDRKVCRVCKCDLIFHIDVIEEDEDDAEEFSSGEEDDIWEQSGGLQESSSDQD